MTVAAAGKIKSAELEVEPAAAGVDVHVDHGVRFVVVVSHRCGGAALHGGGGRRGTARRQQGVGRDGDITGGRR